MILWRRSSDRFHMIGLAIGAVSETTTLLGALISNGRPCALGLLGHAGTRL